MTIDALFGDGHEHTLVLAHLDLEGHEADALRGANATLRRDRPVLTVETFPSSMAEWHRQVMALLEAHNYQVYTVEEKVGWPPDGRNHVGIPREDRRLRFLHPGQLLRQAAARPRWRTSGGEGAYGRGARGCCVWVVPWAPTPGWRRASPRSTSAAAMRRSRRWRTPGAMSAAECGGSKHAAHDKPCSEKGDDDAGGERDCPCSDDGTEYAESDCGCATNN